MKYKWKKMIALSLVVCMFVLSTAGCGFASPPADELDAPIKLDTPEPVTDGADMTEPDDDESNVTEPDNDESNVTETDDDETDLSTQDDKTEPNTDKADTSGKWHVYDSDVAAAVDADFEGMVYKIDTDSFFIVPEETTLEDGALMKGSPAVGIEIPDEELVKVLFDSDTVFTLRDIYEGGARYEDSDASYSNIEKEVSVSLKGEFQNDIFHARAVRIIKVHW